MADFNQAKVLQILQSAITSQQALNQAILQQLIDLKAERAETQWVSLEEGAKAMGSAFSARKILEDLKAGFLKHGTHYINTSNGQRPNYAVKVAALRRVYESPPEKRRAY
ncbi:MAG: hypothetical protein AAF703_20975 [Cyanobacteria bacterium P01_D01_bin.105]